MEDHRLEEVFEIMEALSSLTTLDPITRRPTQNEIQTAEAALGVRLPPSFVEYYAKSKWHVRWIVNISLCSVVPLFEGQPSIVECNLNLRDKKANKYPLPDFLICFDVSAAIDDDYACFDSRQRSATGEYPVVYWSSEEGDYYETVESNTGEICKVDDLREIAPNFSSYIYDIVQEQIAVSEKAGGP